MSEAMDKAFQALEAMTLSRDALIRALTPGRDIDAACGYPAVVGSADYKTLYDRNGVAARVVDVLPEECWGAPPEVYETEDENKTLFEEAWDALAKEHSVFEYLSRIDLLSGVGRYGLMIVGVSDGGLLESEAKPGKDRKLLYLKPVDESVVTVKVKDTDATSPRFGYPVTYSVKFESLDGTSDSEEKLVHWTRVLHVADGRRSSDLFGTPRMQQVYNYLLDLKKVGGGSGEMFWRGGFPGIGFKINPERTTPLTTEEKAAMKAEMLAYSDGLQRYIALTNMEATSLAPQVADPAAHAELQVKLIAITLGVPYRVFLGTEEAKLASSQDVKTWNKRLAARQNGYLTPRIVRPFVDMLVKLGVLPAPKEYFVDWPSLGTLDEKDASEVARNKTDALAKYVGGQVDAVMAPQEYLTMVLGLTADEAAAVIDAAAKRVKESTGDEDEGADENTEEDENPDDSEQ